MNVPDAIWNAPAVVGRLSAREKFRAMQDMPSGTETTPWMWVLVAVMAAGVVAGIVVAVVRGRRRGRASRSRKASNQESRGWDSFRRSAKDRGLTGDEERLMSNLARLADMKDPQDALAGEEAFDRAVGALDAKHRNAMPPDVLQRTEEAIRRLRGKLAFAPHDAADKTPATVSTRQIHETALLELTFPVRHAKANGEVASNLPDGIAVTPHAPVECESGEAVRVRHTDKGVVWEFDTTVLRLFDNVILLAHTDTTPFSNRRRFTRVPTSRQAFAAPFPFLLAEPDKAVPQFLPATLVAIGGAGMQIEVPFQLAKGDRMLLVVLLDARRVVQGVTRVHRVVEVDNDTPLEAGHFVVAVEMIDLSSTELALLARETAAAARQARQQSKPAAEAARANA